MPLRHGYELTIRHGMGLVAIAGVVLGLFAAHGQDQDVVAAFLLAALTIVVPIHFAIEGNRRDGIALSDHRESEPDPTGVDDSF
jgi:hypothetical protein